MWEKYAMRYVRRNSGWIQACLGLLLTVLIGVYVNVLTNAMASSRPVGSVRAVVGALGLWNVLAVLAVVILCFQTYLAQAPAAELRASRSEIITKILELACRSLIYPHRNRHIRAIVTLCDKEHRTRRTTYTYNVRPDPERTATFPVDFGITGEAYVNRAAVARELPADHLAAYEPGVRRLILPGLRCVMGVPLFDPSRQDGPPLGVLAFDSEESMTTLRWDRRDALDLAQAWADLVAELVDI